MWRNCRFYIQICTGLYGLQDSSTINMKLLTPSSTQTVSIGWNDELHMCETSMKTLSTDRRNVIQSSNTSAHTHRFWSSMRSPDRDIHTFMHASTTSDECAKKQKKRKEHIYPIQNYRRATSYDVIIDLTDEPNHKHQCVCMHANYFVTLETNRWTNSWSMI